MLSMYEYYNVANQYILGFVYRKQVYMVTIDSLEPNMVYTTTASRGQGTALRYRLRKEQKLALLHKAVCLGSIDILVADKYNKGELFEKIVTEWHNQVWCKDSVPFYVDGDLTVDGIKYQIKFEYASLCTSKTLERLATAH